MAKNRETWDRASPDANLHFKTEPPSHMRYMKYGGRRRGQVYGLGGTLMYALSRRQRSETGMDVGRSWVMVGFFVGLGGSEIR